MKAQYDISGDVQELSPMHSTVKMSHDILLEVEEMESVLLTRYCSSLLPFSYTHDKTRVRTSCSVVSEHTAPAAPSPG